MLDSHLIDTQLKMWALQVPLHMTNNHGVMYLLSPNHLIIMLLWLRIGKFLRTTKFIPKVVWEAYISILYNICSEYPRLVPGVRLSYPFRVIFGLPIPWFAV